MRPSSGGCRVSVAVASRNLAKLWSVGAIALILLWALSSTGILTAAIGTFDPQPAGLETEQPDVQPSELPRSVSKTVKLVTLLTPQSDESVPPDSNNFKAVHTRIAAEPLFGTPAVESIVATNNFDLKHVRAFNSRAPPKLKTL
jgi:hypothetical protein